MTCEERDLKLLLYVHKELMPLDRLGTWLHLERCQRCRSQVARKQALAVVTADIIASRRERPWMPPAARRPSTVARLQMLAIVLTLAVMAGGTISILHTLRTTARTTVPVSGPCSPGLPNSNCR